MNNIHHISKPKTHLLMQLLPPLSIRHLQRRAQTLVHLRQEFCPCHRRPTSTWASTPSDEPITASTTSSPSPSTPILSGETVISDLRRPQREEVEHEPSRIGIASGSPSEKEKQLLLAVCSRTRSKATKSNLEALVAKSAGFCLRLN